MLVLPRPANQRLIAAKAIIRFIIPDQKSTWQLITGFQNEIAYVVDNTMDFHWNISGCRQWHSIYLEEGSLNNDWKSKHLWAVFIFTKSRVSEAEEATVRSVDDGMDDVSQRTRAYFGLKQTKLSTISIHPFAKWVWLFFSRLSICIIKTYKT